MRCALARVALLVTLLLSLGPTSGSATAGTLSEALRANGVSPPSDLPDLDRPVEVVVLTADGATTGAVYAVAEPAQPARLVALRFEPRTGAVTREPLAWPPSAPAGLDPLTCGRLDSATAHAGRVIVTAHVNPSAACTLVLEPDLRLRAVLGGWPVATLPNGRLLYQRNQVHLAPVHPLALHLFDPAGLADTLFYPHPPYQATRVAHIARMRQVYTHAWCAQHNHPCDPDVFDEHRVGDVLVDPRGDALAFAVTFDNTTGWSKTERWGRLEAFRELRAALREWDGGAEPTAGLARSLVAGLTRARNLQAERHVAAALSGDPELRDMVNQVMATARPDSVNVARWLAALDPRWDDAATWRRLAALVQVPDEQTEVIYVYAGLRPPGGIRYRELPRSEFEARFGHDSLAPALEPSALRALFAPE